MAIDRDELPCEQVEPRTLDDGEMALWTTFLQASLLALEELGRALTVHDLTLDDYEILVFLSAAPDQQLAMSDLAERTLSAKSRLTYRVDRLERGGFVRRVRCGNDGRRVWATLTPEGFALLEQAWPAHLASVRRFVVDPVSPHDRPATTRSLQRMVDALRSVNDDR